MIEKRLSLTHHGRSMPVTLCLAEGGERRPTVIFSHGFGGRGEDFGREARELAQRGYNGVFFDFCGGSRVPNETFPSTEMTWETEKEDLRAVMDYCAENLRPERLYLFGASHGGLITALLAEESEERTDGITLLYPALCVADDWRKRFPEPEDIPDSQDLWGIELGRRYFLDIHDADIFSLIGGYSKPVLIMHGGKDAVVPASYSERAAALYPRAVYVPFEGEGHGFGREAGEKVFRLLLEQIEGDMGAASGV